MESRITEDVLPVPERMESGKETKGHEDKGKKVFSTLLMAVGAVFIVISGGIFVSQTWHYLPEMVKKMCLVAVTAGFFGGSLYLEKNTDLRKAPALFWYLGTCFAGFTTLSLLSVDWMCFSQKLTMAFAVMSVPVILHFHKKQSLADFIFQMLLADGMVLCVGQYPVSSPEGITCISLSLVTMLLAGFVHYGSREFPEEKTMLLVAQIACWAHMVLSLPWILVCVVVEKDFVYTVLPVLMLTATLTLLYMQNRNTIIRIVQSMSLFLSTMSVVVYVGETFLKIGGITEGEFFVAFLINLALMVWLERKEMFISNGFMASFVTIFQIAAYQDSWRYDGTRIALWPFAFCMAGAVLVHKALKKEELNSWNALKGAASWAAMGLHGLLCWIFPENYAVYHGTTFWFCLVFLQICALIPEPEFLRGLKASLKTLSLLIFLLSLGDKPVIPVVFHDAQGVKVLADFTTEYVCILLGLGIVLLGKIWYDILGSGVRKMQFICTCMVLLILVCSNLADPALPNVMFLGISTLIMLITATILKKKDYALASAITLILVVLYLTKEVWMSIAWWVYLFVAGVGLVIFAIRREKAE